ncbi:hypothetical protein ACIBK9_47330 [Nonomuraea sp. NPDC050227]|uniref:hypothetical protein n=1 Tax=Nonomuraea sp. NPDC050227 TaxID=3364360 RepID=UPI0037ABCEE6
MADTEKTLSDELRAAAAKLREAAADAHGGPWGMADVGIAVISADVQPYGAPCVADRLYEGDARWMVLTNPLLGEPLASWLETTSHVIDSFRLPTHPLHEPCDDPCCYTAHHALAVARVLNGTST